jgi:hypothetical protein
MTRFPIATDGFGIDPLTASDDQFNFSGLQTNRSVPGGMRVWEIAQLLRVESRTVREIALSVGVRVRSISSMIEPACAASIIAHIRKGGN